MINFIIAARRKREDTQERYFYEWGTIHVALMISTPQVMQLFKRYVQHYSVSGVTNDMLLHPLSEMEWDNMAEHWVETYDDFLRSTRLEDYVARMQPHKFGDSNFVLMLAHRETVFEEENFKGGCGGVKLIHFLCRKPNVTQEQFNTAWQAHGQIIERLNTERPLIRKYVQDRKLEVPSGNFSGSLFAQGDTEGHAGVEEFWFRSLDDLAQLQHDTKWREALLTSESKFVDAMCTFSMVTTERIIYDYAQGTNGSPVASVLKPDSLEAAVFRQGLGGWNIPKPVPLA